MKRYLRLGKWSALTPTLSPRRGSARSVFSHPGSFAASEAVSFAEGRVQISGRLHRAPSPGGEGWGEGGSSLAHELMRIVVVLAFVLSHSLASGQDSKPESPKAASLPVAELRRETPVDFEKEILPIFRGSCLACPPTII